MKSSSGARNRMKRGRRNPGRRRDGAGIKKRNRRETREIRGAAGEREQRSGKARVGNVMIQVREEHEWSRRDAVELWKRRCTEEL